MYSNHPPPVICHSKSRIKTLETKPQLRCPARGVLGDGGRDKLGSTDIVWFAVRTKFATGKLA